MLKNLLVGETTVIEHAGVYIEWSRTYSHVKFQPIKAHIGFVLPKEISLPDGYLLARGIVDAQLGLGVKKPRRVEELCRKVFGCELIDLMEEE